MMSANYRSVYKARSFAGHKENENNVLPIDKELLRTLLTIQAPSEYEEDMQKFVKEWIDDNVPTAKVSFDNYGNIYVVKGKSNTFPCVVAHMDEVNDFHSDRQVIELGNLFVGLNRLTGEFAGCPGDDRVGCYTALELLRVLPNIKVAFFVEEEIGGKGSYASNINFFKDCAFILQADRNGNDEVINVTNGSTVASESFCDALVPYMEKYNYSFGFGTFTDVGVLSNRGVGISCLNLGCGYFDAHSEEEKVCIPDVENILNLMYFFCIYLADRKWKHKSDYLVRKKAGQGKKGGGGRNGTANGNSFSLDGSFGPGDEWDDDYWDYSAPLPNSFPSKTKPTNKIDVDFNFIPDDDIPCMTCRDFDCMNCDKYN